MKEALEVVGHPIIEREVMVDLRDRGRLAYDGDLTNRPVSSTSYPGAAFD